MQSRRTTEVVLQALLVAQGEGQSAVSPRSEMPTNQFTLPREAPRGRRKMMRYTRDRFDEAAPKRDQPVPRPVLGFNHPANAVYPRSFDYMV